MLSSHTISRRLTGPRTLAVLAVTIKLTGVEGLAVTHEPAKRAASTERTVVALGVMNGCLNLTLAELVDLSICTSCGDATDRGETTLTAQRDRPVPAIMEYPSR